MGTCPEDPRPADAQRTAEEGRASGVADGDRGRSESVRREEEGLAAIDGEAAVNVPRKNPCGAGAAAEGPGVAIHPGKREFLATALACVALYAATALGAGWGYAASHGFGPLADVCHLPGFFGVSLLGFEGLGYLASRLWGSRRPDARWICTPLCCFTILLMQGEAFDCGHEDQFVVGVLLLLPFLLTLGPLIRAGAWLGALGVGLFYVSAIAMLIVNAFAIRWGIGFFGHWIV